MNTNNFEEYEDHHIMQELEIDEWEATHRLDDLESLCEEMGFSYE